MSQPESFYSGDGVARLRIGWAIALIAALLFISSMADPRLGTMRGPWPTTAMCLVLLVDGAVYLGEDRLRALGDTGILCLHGLLLFAFGALSPNFWLNVAIFAVFAAYASRRFDRFRRRVVILPATIVWFAASTALGTTVYRGASVALLLAGFALLSEAFLVLRPRHDRVLESDAERAMPIVAERGVRRLTSRELEVLRLAATGAPSHEMAKRLGVTERTVKAHLSSIYRRLGVDTRAAAIARASEEGLLSRSEK